MKKKHNGQDHPDETIIDRLLPVGWKRIELGQFGPSIDLSHPPAYIMDIAGQRTDGVVFKVRVALDKKKFDLIPNTAMALRVARDAMQNGLNQLQTFTECACTLDTSCKEHQTQ